MLVQAVEVVFVFSRYAHIGDATVGHAAHVGQCPPALLLCFLHLWHCWRTAVGGPATQPLLPGPAGGGGAA